MAKASKASKRIGSYVIETTVKQGNSGGAIQSKRVIGPDGRLVGIQTIDARSRTFGEDLTKVFAKNVARHRIANTKIAGKKG